MVPPNHCMQLMLGVMRNSNRQAPSVLSHGGFDTLDILGGWGVDGMPQIPVALAVEPELRCGLEKFCQTQRRVRCDTTLSIDDFIHPRIRYMDSIRKIRLGHVERL